MLFNIQYFRLAVILSLLLGLTGSLQAKKPNWVNDKAPDSYVVRKGDTLWEIAGIYLHEPWRWPAIWENNPDIENPHLIYPGDRILLQYDGNGRPKLRLERGSRYGRTESYWQNGEKVVKLSPRIRSHPADGAVPTVPTHVIQPFFNRSRVISQAHADHCPPIVAVDEDHLLVGEGDRIYVSNVRADSPTELFSVFRVEKLYEHPYTNEILGIEGLILGKAQIEIPGNPASLILKKSYAEIRVGDRLIEPVHEQVDAFFLPKAPVGNPSGQIISVFGGLSQIGQYQVIVITGGNDQSREVGDVLAVYQNQKDMPSRLTTDNPKVYDFPSLKIARLVVFRVFDKVSYALVMSATRPIYIRDNVGHP